MISEQKVFRIEDDRKNTVAPRDGLKSGEAKCSKSIDKAVTTPTCVATNKNGETKTIRFSIADDHRKQDNGMKWLEP